MFLIKRVKFINIRGFKELIIDFNSNENNIVNNKLIIGKNGTCKTTILRCLAIGLCDQADGNGLLAENFGELILEDKKEGWIYIDLFDQKNPLNKIKITTQIKKIEGKEEVGEKTQINGAIFVCGYGAARALEGAPQVRRYRIADSVYSLFRYDADFWSRELVIRRLKDYLGSSFYASTIRNIKKIMGLAPMDKIYIEKGGGVYISGPKIGKKIPIEGWADGFQMTLLWILDLFGWALIAQNLSNDGQISGILLVDEIEQHIHPSMQISILNQLKKFFPHLQIITTTHSPLVALGSSQSELIVLKRKRKYVYKEENVPDFSKYSADDIISDDNLFSSSSQNPVYEKKLRLYNNLIDAGKGKLSKKESNKVKKLASDLIRSERNESREDKLLVELRNLKEKYSL